MVGCRWRRRKVFQLRERLLRRALGVEILGFRRGRGTSAWWLL